MNLHESQSRRLAARHARRRGRRARLLAATGLVAGIAAVVAVLASGGGARPKPAAARTGRQLTAAHRGRARPAAARGSTVTGRPTDVRGTVHVPVLMYHVIAPPPAGAPFPGLYVDAGEFAAQMQALKDAGWHAVTLDQLRANWLRGVPLGPGKPIVLTFDNGYHSQYTAALPVLSRLHWVADENIQLTGLPPSQGGLSDAEVRGLVAAGWELDTQGISHADLIALDPSALRDQVVTARRVLQQRYHVPVNWFAYPSGHYNTTVVAAARAAGYVGSTTVIPGWANPAEDPFALPRLRVLGGTSPTALLSQIQSAQSDPAPGGSYSGA